VVLDNSSTHKGEPLQQLLRQHSRLQLSTFLPMLRSSIPMRGFGVWRNERSPIVVQMMWRSWSRMSFARSMGFVSQLGSCAAAYCNLDCPLFCASPLHYLCRHQIALTWAPLARIRRYDARRLHGHVLAQRELERRRSPLVQRFRPCGAGVFLRRWGSIVR
jgi:hypothetical protein